MLGLVLVLDDALVSPLESSGITRHEQLGVIVQNRVPAEPVTRHMRQLSRQSLQILPNTPDTSRKSTVKRLQ